MGREQKELVPVVTWSLRVPPGVSLQFPWTRPALRWAGAAKAPVLWHERMGPGQVAGLQGPRAVPRGRESGPHVDLAPRGGGRVCGYPVSMGPCENALGGPCPSLCRCGNRPETGVTCPRPSGRGVG